MIREPRSYKLAFIDLDDTLLGPTKDIDRTNLRALTRLRKAGVQIAISQPIRIGDRVSFEETEGRVTDITLSYTYVDPGDGSSVVIPNQLLTEGIVHNHSTEDTVA